MRLHHLRMTAIGPFAGAEEVDFDELCDAGLFLLTGPTGAGKTTILDAVCFALYGSVPGVRGVKALKSQHAEDDMRPEVVLDFSVRARRFVIRRSPEWSRPKRRGEGLTTQNATASLVETTTGEDHLLSSRAQEVGHFVAELVGMQATQFVQVAMLPQGDFQRFLRATSQERHDVLQHLFRTDRYARIEDWVHDHSRRLRDRSATAQQAVARVLDTVADRVGAELPAQLRDDALHATDVRDHAAAWVGSLLDGTATAHGAAKDQHAAAASAAAQERARLDAGLRLRDLLVRRDRARATLDALAAEDDAEHRSRRLLDADDRAARCLPLLRMLDDAEQEASLRRAAWARAERRLAETALPAPLPDALTTAALAGLEQQAQSRAARLEALLPREKELREAEAGVAAAGVELASVEQEHAALETRSAGLPAALSEAQQRGTALATLAGRAEALDLELQQARRRLDAARDAERCASSLLALRDAERDARDTTADARDLVQQLTERRLAGVAAELAGALVTGTACQVCGSIEHPAPARSTAPGVTETEQSEAAAAYDAAAATYRAASATLLRAEERLSGLRTAAAGLDTTAAEAEAERLERQLDEAHQAAQELRDAEGLVERLRTEQDAVTASLHELTVRTATLTQACQADHRTVDRLSRELAAEVQHGTPLSDQVLELNAFADSLARARESLDAHDAATVRAEELRSNADGAANEHGFGDARDLRAAVLDPAERTGHEELLSSRAQARARAQAVLDDGAVRCLEDAAPPDVTELEGARARADKEETSTARSLHQHEELLASLTRQRDRLTDALDAWEPVRIEHLRADSMSKLVRGMGVDNQLQMRLSAYVLATRLDQVVAAANERLGHMRDHRYLLQRTGRAARKGAQAGLGLEVVDQWTGDVRDPTTLSGGETFVVSLSLALGLADVVTQEAGGTEIETLFVDEGFGTLDADTLDDVMDRLDDLRVGGRAVGVVSHVSELRNRIPTQLHVEKRRTGSTITVRTAVG
jgi:exonuclease SbcC